MWNHGLFSQAGVSQASYCAGKTQCRVLQRYIGNDKSWWRAYFKNRKINKTWKKVEMWHSEKHTFRCVLSNDGGIMTSYQLISYNVPQLWPFRTGDRGYLRVSYSTWHRYTGSRSFGPARRVAGASLLLRPTNAHKWPTHPSQWISAVDWTLIRLIQYITTSLESHIGVMTVNAKLYSFISFIQYIGVQIKHAFSCISIQSQIKLKILGLMQKVIFLKDLT